MRKLIVINLVGGPGIGKSTQAADVFSILKKKGYNCELITEYAKDMTWQESFKVMTNQLYVFAKQHQKLFRVNGKVDIAVTDSPLVTSLFYMKEENQALKNLILEEYDKYENFMFLLKRETEYQQHGRYQDLNGAIEVDKNVINILKNNHIKYREISLEGAAEKIVELVESRVINNQETYDYFKNRGVQLKEYLEIDFPEYIKIKATNSVISTAMRLHDEESGYYWRHAGLWGVNVIKTIHGLKTTCFDMPWLDNLDCEEITREEWAKDNEGYV